MVIARAYSTLGLRSGASRQELRTAYRTRLQEHHPDGGGSGDWAALAEIRSAYRTLAQHPVVRAEPAPGRAPLIDVYA